MPRPSNAPVLQARLSSPNGPLVLAPDVAMLLGTHGADVAQRLRIAPGSIVAAQRLAIDAGADVIVAPTAATTPAALHAIGESYRSAALTALAIDLAREAIGPGRTLVLGTLEPEGSSERDREEAATHVARLSASGADGVILRHADAEARRAVLDAAAAYDLPTIVELTDEALAALDAPLGLAAVLVRGAEGLETIVARTRARTPVSPIGVRLVGDVEAGWRRASKLRLALVGIGEEGSLASLRTLAALVHRHVTATA